MNRLEASHLRKTFGSTVAVKDLDLAIAEGEIYGLVGPDGAGKTTTIRMLCGAYQPDKQVNGHSPLIKIAGYNMLTQTEEARTQIGYLPQRFSLYEELTVLENIRFFAEVRGLKATEWQPRCMDILAFVGLADFINRKAGHLSGGMRQKLGLAAALVHQPKVLLLDEPTTGVDPVTRQDFWQLIIRLVSNSKAREDLNGEKGTTVLVSTPYMDEAARCTRIGFMRQGQLIIEGTPGTLCAQLEGRVLEFAGQPLTKIRTIVEDFRNSPKSNLEGVQMFGDRLHLRVKQGTANQVMDSIIKLTEATSGVQILRLRPIPAQLEDVFMGLLEEKG